MAKSRMGDGYGSECHLLRYLGRHRGHLDGAAGECLGGEVLEWLDFAFDPSMKRWPDRELKGVEFLPDDSPAKDAWGRFWATTGEPPNWDAVGRARVGGVDEWVLVEAKAHVDELGKDEACGAAEHGGRPRIRSALSETIEDLGATAEAEVWLSSYYQYANRLAVLHLLTSRGAPARLLYVLFTGDSVPGKECPKDEAGWRGASRRWTGRWGSRERASSRNACTGSSCPSARRRPDRGTPGEAAGRGERCRARRSRGCAGPRIWLQPCARRSCA